MEKKEDLNQVLNDLLKINNDRMEVYKKAIREIYEFDIKALFAGMVEECRKFSVKLALEVLRRGGTPMVGSTTTAGKIYRFWQEIKESLLGTDRESILNACEFVDDAIQRVYGKALEHSDLSPELRSEIMNQRSMRVTYGLARK
jgi:uncharacterized protein (TIGR02284 family)